ncbi:5-carboxymethyl-2-hydroxymuconate Delta-isomerase [Burkholderia gladioli]|uniref:5-carboxymethyl-2-hydroxymuconate Delta-isomerase n=1 Tax=Burkholderia gladioli TaxID=28095 RepID=UPI0016415088|nr:hypothetical protein [Burkholderia gladioli]
MPHLIFESTPQLAESIDFPSLMLDVHANLARNGYATLSDLKSRSYEAEGFLAGDDATAQFIVVRLLLTKTRTASVQHAMGQLIHDAVRAAIERAGVGGSWQCAVLVVDESGAPYIKTVQTATLV